MSKLVFTVAILLSAIAVAGEDHSVGNGGDVIRKLFIDAKRVAAHKLKHLKQCSFDGQDDMDAINFALQHATKLADEVTNSAHYWTVDQQATCGYTTRESNAGIYLSYPTCINSIRDMHDATFVLLHESTHHLGTVDEKFADRVAIAIMKSVPKSSCPHSGGEVFESNYCQGSEITKDQVLRYFQPGDSTAFFTTMKVKRRERACNKATGCVPTWTDGAVVFYDYRDKASFAASELSCQFVIEDSGSSVPYYCKAGNNEVSITLRRGAHSPVRWSGAAYIKYFLSNGSGLDIYNDHMKGLITNQCFWYKSSGSTSPEANGNYLESETVFYSDYTPK